MSFISDVKWIQLSEVDSTNTYLLQKMKDLKGPAVVSAKQQTAGRGRQGKVWSSEPGQQLMFSLYWPWTAKHSPAALSLVVAKAMALYLTDLLTDGERVTVKWPNDLQINGRKLAGILLESQTRGDLIGVVIGVGINYAKLSALLLEQIGQSVVALADHCVKLPAQDMLLAGLVDVILTVCLESQQVGFENLLQDWQTVDALHRREVVVTQPKQTLTGIADGVDASGALILRQPNGVQKIFSGTLRPLS